MGLSQRALPSSVDLCDSMTCTQLSKQNTMSYDGCARGVQEEQRREKLMLAQDILKMPLK